MKENAFLNHVWKILKTILLILTAPVWVPWKVLFVRPEGEKFKDVDDKTKMWRLTRSFFTKILKFAIFLLVILLEILLVHKVRYSVVTYPLTKNAVRQFYLNENKLEDIGVEEDKLSDFEIMLGFIDTWDLDEKNKMHVILNSDLVKYAIKYSDNETVFYVIHKFNEDVVFRENVRKLIKNVNTTITRFINEIPENDFARLNNFLGPIITVSSWAIDYAGVLNIGGAVFNWAVTKYNIEEKSLHANAFDIEKAIKSVFDYSNGASLNTVTNYWR